MRKRKSDHELAEEIANRLTNTPSGGRGPAADAQVLLQHAANAGGGGLRQQYLEQAQREIAKLDPGRYRVTIQRLQSQVLALQGRGGDTRIAHVTPGEIVIPRHMQSPEFMAGFVRLARAHGIDPAQFQIGNPHNKINPQTGQPEFQDGSNPYEWSEETPTPWGNTLSPNRQHEWLQPWIGDQNVLHPITPDQASGMNNNLLGNYDRANGVARAIDKGVRAIGQVGVQMLPGPAGNVPVPIFENEFGPFDENKKAINDEIQRRRDQGFWK